MRMQFEKKKDEMILLQTEESCSTISFRPHGLLIIHRMNIHLTTEVRVEQRSFFFSFFCFDFFQKDHSQMCVSCQWDEAEMSVYTLHGLTCCGCKSRIKADTQLHPL